ncbi:papain-like cysteine protease family protein [Amycolatopsis sp. lyj-112]|uniref:papain-like cysteine protease family protein n=1 Tax=Amycolatopsis sp. lyj-112 TaxID=2789288 RepID=UPI00397B257F
MKSLSSRRATRFALVTGATALALSLLPAAALAQPGDEGSRPSGLVKTGTHTQVREVAPLRGGVGAAVVADAVATSKQLNYSQQVQQYDQWCWAADGSSIERSQGGGATQAQFCAAGKGTQAGYCPNQAAQIPEIIRGFRGTGFSAQDAGGPIGFNSVVSQIDAGILNLTGIYWTSGGGHAEVIYGYDTANQSIMVGDPWPTYQRYQTWNYNQYVRNSQFNWNDTIVNIRKG